MKNNAVFSAWYRFPTSISGSLEFWLSLKNLNQTLLKIKSI